MKNIFLIFTFLFSILNFSQSEINSCETFVKINKLLQENHYRPKKIDDSLSSYVFKKVIENLDENGRYLLSSEMDILKKHQYSIDNHIDDRTCSFIDDFYTIYTNAVHRYSKIIAEIKAEPLESSSTEKIFFDKQKNPYCKTEADLKAIYKKSILFFSLKNIAEISENKDSLTTNLKTLFLKEKNKIFENYECRSSKALISKEELNSYFYNAFCNYFDPHSEYFTEDDKTNFYSSVSSDNLSFGMVLDFDEDSNKISIQDIILDSSAHENDKIEKNDEIIKIKYDSVEYQLSCSTKTKIQEILYTDSYKKAEFTFRKKTGEIYNAVLSKKLVKDYENKIFSFVLEKDNSRVGYIKIPSFYGEFENGKTSTSNDLARELFKLENENIDGIIIDLENNGGGSMFEAERLSSFFIDKGPIAVMKNQYNNTSVIKDQNKGMIYDGPMAILINGLSASASEFFTNAMQDYKRAIVIGGKSYGKATMQRVFPLDKTNKEFVKITLEEFYRITGKTNQNIGIQPDVEISSLYENQYPKEKTYETAIVNDEIKNKIKFKTYESNYSNAIENYKTRTSENSNFKEIKDLNSEIDTLYDNDLKPIDLNFSAVFDDVLKVNILWKKMKSVYDKLYDFKVIQNKNDVENEKKDSFLKSYNSENIKSIKSNFRISETLNIFKDLKK